MKISICIVSCFLYWALGVASAETCLPVAALKTNNFQGWVAYDADNGDPVSGSRLQQYEKRVTHFALATWLAGAPEGEAQCYYRDQHDPYYLNIYLAKVNLVPDKQLSPR